MMRKLTILAMMAVAAWGTAQVVQTGAAEDSLYRATHHWQMVPVGRAELCCTMCDYRVSGEDSIYCRAMRRDTLYHLERKELALGITYWEVHKLRVPEGLWDDVRFVRHVGLFADSLRADRYLMDKAELLNALHFLDAYDALVREAPYGFVNTWRWMNHGDCLGFTLEFTNLNKRTIRQLRVCFEVSDAAGRVLLSGELSGSGPVKQDEAATWEWPRSTYRLPEGAADLRITRIVIGYRNGSQEVIEGDPPSPPLGGDG